MLAQRPKFTETWPKRCACGAFHDEERWETLRYVGIQESGMSDVPNLELRTCDKCSSTIAIAVTDDFAK